MGLLCRSLAPSPAPVAVANMRALCQFAHMVYDIAAERSSMDADVSRRFQLNISCQRLFATCMLIRSPFCLA